jgi:16S rRNA (adenine1518-N6/adenine1519-N6)-dimethyltransferase
MGVLTNYLLERPLELVAMDLDRESIAYLEQNFHSDKLTIVHADFLKFDLKALFGERPFAIIGNYPYNISSQIVFKMLDLRKQIPEFSGMLQKEVAQRICSEHGSKTYGILSVLVQTFYTAEYLFEVKPGAFNPPPKVDSAVIRLTRRREFSPGCNEELLFKLVKQAFQQRRKTLRNSLKSLNLPQKLREDAIFGLRPEQLSVANFVELTSKIERDALSADD